MKPEDLNQIKKFKKEELVRLVTNLENCIAWQEHDIEELKRENSFLKLRSLRQRIFDVQYRL